MNKFLLLSLLTFFSINVSAQVNDSEKRAVEAVISHFQNTAQEKGYSNSDFEQPIITDVYTSKHNNVTHIYLRQQHNGIEVYSANANGNVWKDKILNSGNQFQYNLNRKVNTTTPAISAAQAIEYAATHLKLTAKTFKSIEKKNDSAQGEVFSDAGISCDPIPARLVYQPVAEQKTVKLAWEVIIHQLNHEHWWSIRIDAQTGDFLDKNDWVVHCSFGEHDDNSCDNHTHQNTLSKQTANSKSNNKVKTTTNATALANTYNVYPLPIESPSHGTRSVVSAPWTAAGLAGTLGWHNDGATNYTIARGNNVYAQEDLNADNVVGYSPDGGATLDFNFPLNLNQDPSNYLDPAITNLFYWNNIMHDIWYQYGFDEVSGNFQNDNQGRGGAQNDYVIADAQDGSATNNANFATPPDGSTPRMQMFEWSGGGVVNALTVNAPVGISGTYQAVEAGGFGPSLPVTPTAITGNVVLADDGTAAPTEACNALINGAAINGNIAMIDRANCNFTVKVKNAENAGAVACIVCNNVAGTPFAMGGTDATITIPSVMISQVDCAMLKAQLAAGVNVSLSNPGTFNFDSDLDNGIICHEYGHGISTRLTGGPNNASCLGNDEQMGEGWSDWLGLMLTLEPGDARNDVRGIGTYVIGQTTAGGGIRPAPYSTDFGVNSYTYAGSNSGVSVPHGIGFVWCTALWEMTWDLIDNYGFDADFYNGTGGNNIAMQLVIDGMKLQPCSPGMIDGRDAILMADTVNYGGQYSCEIWEAFARRGFGFSADQGSSGSRSDQVEAFDMPPACLATLKIAKTVDSLEVGAGNTMKYTFVINNDKPIAATGTTITDVLPSNVTYVNGSLTCAGAESGGTVTINVGTIPASGSITCSFDVTVATSPFSTFLFTEDHETVSTFTSSSGTGANTWVASTANANSGTNHWYVPNSAADNDQYLTTTATSLPTGTPLMRFWHAYNTEASWDGGMVEISINGGVTWADLGNDMIMNGYNGVIGSNNPVGARDAFSGNSGGYIETRVDLASYAGQNAQFRFRFASDNNTVVDGWYMDDFEILDAVYIDNNAIVTSNEGDIENNIARSLVWAAACPEVCVESPVYIDCESNPVQLDGTCSMGDIVTIQWTAINGGNIVSGENTLTPIVDTEGDYILSLTSSDGCVVTDTVIVSNDLDVLNFASVLPYAQELSDIWGYADGNGNEYALVGTTTGLSIVDVTDPYNPVEVQFISIPGLQSTWWDIKTCGDYAYYITEDNNPPGLNIVDLSNLPASAPVTTTQLGVGYTDSHDIFIDENCVGYLFGANTTGVGNGTVIIDIAANPTNPVYLGIYNANYVHDGFVQGDTMYTGEIYAGQMGIVDVSNPAAPVVLGTIPSPLTFTHQVWVTPDNTTAFVLDESSNAVVAVYDVTDPTNIILLDTWNDGNTGVIMHNGFYVDGGFYTLSHYTAGVTVLDVSEPDILVPIGNYDTSPNFSGNGFSGSWGNYPYLPSGNLIATDIEEGLYVFTTTYIPASYLDGCLTDVCTGNIITNAQIDILGVNDEEVNPEITTGCYQTGVPDCGNYNVMISANGYITQTLNVDLNSDEFTTLDVALTPVNGGCCTADAGDILQPNGVTVSVGICLGDDIGTFLNDFTDVTETDPGVGYDYAYIIVQGTNIIASTTTGDFDWTIIPVGNYVVYGLSYSTTNPIANIANYLGTVTTTTEIETDITNATICADLDNLYPDGNEVRVEVFDNPDANAGNDVAICSGESTQLQATGGLNYNWVPATNLSDPTIANPIANPTITTTYTVTVTDIRGCEDTDDVTITVNPLPTADASDNETICRGESAQLQATGGVTYNWTPFGSLNNPNIASPTASPILTTTYTVTVTDANGCEDTDNVTITVNTAPNGNAGNDVAICSGESTQLQATGGVSYNWTPATDINDPTIANPVAKPITTTTYTVTISDANGCEDTDNITVTVNPLPTAFAGNDVAICDGESIQLQSTGGVSYNWTPTTGLNDAAIANPLANPTVTTTYTVTVLDANGCESTDDITVTVNPSPIVDAGNDVAICDGESVQLQATGGVNYSWLPITGLNDATIANPLASPTVTTTYTVTVSNVNGCESTDDVTITVNPLPTADAGDNENICDGESVQLTATGGVVYTWTPSTGLNDDKIANPIANPATTTTYTVTVFGANNCESTDDVTVTVNPLPIAFAGNDVAICDGESVQLQATGGGSYSWTPTTGLNDATLANPLASPTVTTTYTVTVLDANGCEDTDDITITVNPSPIVDAGNDVTICDGESVQLQTTGGVNYSWLPTTGLNDATIANPLASPTVTTTYTVTVFGANNCESSDDITVAVNPLPTADAGDDEIICDGESVQLTATGGVIYVWSPPTGLDDDKVANPLASPTVTTTYTVTVFDANNCESSDDITIIVNPSPIAFAGENETICNGESVQLQATGGENYSWLPVTGLSDATIANPLANPLTTTTYTVRVSNADGCESTDEITVIVNPSPTADAGDDETICDGESVQLTATGGAVYTWSPSTGLNDDKIANPLASPTVTTTYTVTVFDANNCESSDDVTITVSPLPTVFAGEDEIICNGESVQLQATGGVVYAWSPATGLNDDKIANPLASPTVTTTYTVTVFDANNCESSDDITIIVNPSPIAFAGENETICNGESVQLQATGGENYSWLPVTGLSDATIANPLANPLTTTTYTVRVSNADGCESTDEITVIVNPSPTADAGDDETICDGESVQLTATGGAVYTWSPSTGLNDDKIANPLASPTVTTTYTVTVFDANNCESSDDVTITVSPLPTAFAGEDETICNGESVQLQATGGENYNWTPATGLNDATIANPIASPVVTITYTVTVSNADGCESSDDVTVMVNPSPIADAGENEIICDGESIQLQATGGENYSWTPATGLNDDKIANPLASPMVTTTYTVTAINADGCESTDDVTVTVNPLPTAIAGENETICDGESIQLQATGGENYNWTPATGLNDATIANPIASPTVTTTYTVTAINADGCESTDDVTVTVNPSPIADAGENEIICDGESIQLQATGGENYSWTPATGLNDDKIANPLASPTVTTTYTVTAINADGCESTDDVTVTVNPLPTAIAGENETICDGESVQLQATGGENYSWTPTTGLNDATIANPIASPVVTITYTVTVSNVDGCESTDDVTVMVNNSIIITEVDVEDINACGGSNGSIEITASSASTLSYSIDGGITYQSSNTFNDLSSGSYDVVVMNSDGCEENYGSVQVNPLESDIVITAVDVEDINVCGGSNGSIEITASSASTLSYSIDGGITYQSGNTFNDLSSGSYDVVVMNSDGCEENYGSVQVNPLESDIVITAVDVEDINVCGGSNGSIEITASSASTLSYSIDGGITYQSSNTFNDLSSGSYDVVVMNDGDCEENHGLVQVNPLESDIVITAVDVEDINVCEGSDGSIEITASSASVLSYSIDGGITYQSSNTFNDLSSGSYDVVVMNGDGCEENYGSVVVNPLGNDIVIDSVSVDAVSICEGSDGSIIISASSATALSYSIDGGITYQSSNTFNDLSSGSYDVVVMNSDGCEENYGSVVVNPLGNDIVIDSVSVDAVSICEGSDGSIIISASSASTLSYSIDGGITYQSDNTFNNLSSDSYDVVVMNSDGCEANYGSVVVNPLGNDIVIDSVSVDAVSICEGSDGSIIISASSASTLSYSIDGGITYQSDNTFNNLSSDSYDVVVMNSDGCEENYGSVVVNPLGNDIVIDSVSVDAVSICEGSDGSIIISASSASTLSYSIDGGITYQSSNTFNDLSSDSYDVVVMNSDGCEENYGSVVVNPLGNDIVISSVNVNSVSICEGSDGSIEITASSVTALSYSIDGGITYQSNNTFNDLSSGSYNVVVMNSDGCEANYGSVVAVNPLGNDIVIDSVSVDAVSICEGSDGSIEITASSVSTLSYSINGGVTYQSGNTFNNLSSGSYDVVVMNSDGCEENYGSVVVNPLGNDIVIDSVSVDAVSICEGSDGSIIISASSASVLSYSIDGGITYQSSNTFNDLSSGSYDVVVMNSDGCEENYGSVVVNPLGSDIVIGSVAVNGVSICEGSDGSIIISASSASTLSYSIDGGITYQSSNTFNDLSSGSYDVVVMNSDGCEENYGSVVVNPLGSDIVIGSVAVNGVSICEGSDGSIIISASSASTLSYSIDGGITYQSSNTFNDLSSGSYDVVVMNSDGCEENYGSVVVNPLGSDIVIGSVAVNGVSICEGSDGSIIISASSASTLSYSIDGGITYQSSNSFNNLSSGSYDIVVMNSDGCEENYGSVVVNPLGNDIVIDSVSVDAVSICEGSDGSIEITASSASVLSYSIDGGVTYQSGNTFNNLSSGSYNVVVMNSDGCEANYGSVVVNPLGNDIVIDSVSVDGVSICEGSDGSIIISASSTSTLSYSIDGGITYQSSNTFNDLSSGSYNVVVMNSDGCEANYGSVVAVNPLGNDIVIDSVSVDAVSICEGSDGSIIISASSASVLSYSIDGGVTYQSGNTFNNLSSGSYNVVVMNSDGCEENYGSVVVNPLGNDIVIDSVSVDAVSICEGSDGSIIISASSASTLSYSIDGGITYQSSNIFNNLSSGNYDIVVMNSDGCEENYGSVVVNPLGNDIVIDSVSVDAVSICEGSDGSIIISASSASTLSYSIDGGITYQSSNTFNNLSSGSYDVVVMNGDGCEENYGSVVVNPLGSDIVIGSVAVNGVSICEGSDGSIIINASSATTLSYSIDGGITYQSSNTFNNLSSGSYDVVVMNGQGCEENYGSVVVNPLGNDIVIGDVQVSSVNICGGSNGSIIITASSATTLSYSIDGGVTYQSSNTFNDLSSGSYDVVVMNGQGCEENYGVVQVNPQENDAELINVTVTGLTGCNTNDAMINIEGSASGSILYSVDGGENFFVNNVFENLSTGTYDVVILSENTSCIQAWFEQIIINDFDADLVIVSVDITNETSCNANDGMIVINALGDNLQYSINGGASFVSSNSFLELPTGSYSIVTTDAFGCTSTYNEDVIIEAVVNSITINDVISGNISYCNSSDGSILIDATGTGLIYSIDGGESYFTDNLFNDLTSGSYSIMVQDELGCIQTYDELVPIIEPADIIINSVETSDVTCANENNGTIIINAVSESILEYSIDGGIAWQTEVEFINLPEGLYSVLVRSSDNTCDSEYGEVEIVSPTAIVIANINSENLSNCGANDGNISVSAIGGMGVLSYSIDGGISFQTDNVFGNLQSGSYDVIVGDENGCTIESDNSIEIEDVALTLSISPASPNVCVGETVTLTASPSDDNVTYAWSNGETTNEITVSVTETTAFDLTIENEFGCSTTSQVQVGVDQTAIPTANFNVNNESICLGESVTFTDSSENANSYEWIFEGGTPSTSTEPNPSVIYNETGIYSATLIVESCSGSDTFTIETAVEVSDLQISIETDSYEICAGEIAQINLPADIVPSGWSLTSGDFNTVTNEVNTTEDAILIVQYAVGGCSAEFTINIDVIELPTADAGNEINICDSDSIILAVENAEEGIDYTWFVNGETYSDGSVITPDNLTAIILQAENGNGCITEDELIVNISDGAIITSISTDLTICENDEGAVLSASGGVNYEWSVLSGDSSVLDKNKATIIVFPTETTVYQVTVENEFGCVTTATVTIIVKECQDVGSGIVNVITPNNDGVNDVWEISKYTDKIGDDIYLQIYNRWGSLIFESISPSNKWDGRNRNGEPVSDGTYYFILDLRDGKRPLTGTITVLK